MGCVMLGRSGTTKRDEAPGRVGDTGECHELPMIISGALARLIKNDLRDSRDRTGQRVRLGQTVRESQPRLDLGASAPSEAKLGRGLRAVKHGGTFGPLPVAVAAASSTPFGTGIAVPSRLVVGRR